MCVGGFHLFSGLMSVMIVNFQKSVMGIAAPETQHVLKMAHQIHSTLLVYMPYLALIGLLILIFGWQLKKLLAYAFWINFALTIALIVWIVFMVFPLMDSFKSFSHTFTDFPADMSNFMDTFRYVAVGINLIFFITPQVIIFVRLKKLNSPNKEAVPTEEKDLQLK